MTERSKDYLKDLFYAGAQPPNTAWYDFIDSLQRQAVLDVRDYGAVGDGLTDDTAAFQAAIVAGHGISMPADKTFLISDQISLPDGNINIYGQGNSSVIKFSPSSSKTLFDISDSGSPNVWSVRLANFRIEAGNTNPLNAISIVNGTNIQIENVEINGQVGGGSGFTFAAIKIMGASPLNSFAIQISHCLIENIHGDGVYLGGDIGSQFWMHHTTLSQGSGYGVHVDSTVAQAITLDANVIQGFYYGNIRTTPIWAGRITSCHLENGGGVTAPCISMEGSLVKCAIVIESNVLGALDAAYAIDFPNAAGNGYPRGIRISNNLITGASGKKVCRVQFACSAVEFLQNDLASYGTLDIRTLLDLTYAQSVVIHDATGFDIYSVGAPATVNYPIFRMGDNRMVSGTAAPTTGTWQRGDMVWTPTPTAGGVPGWICVTAGTPGTWKAMAALAA